MILKRTMSAVIAVAAAASTMVCFAVSANAKDTTLTYVNSGTTLTTFEYSTVEIGSGNDFSNGTEFTLNDDGKAALAEAKAGDTLVITYTITHEDGQAQRCGFKIGGHQVSVNPAHKTDYDPHNSIYHINANFDKNDSTDVKYTFTFVTDDNVDMDFELTCGNDTAVSNSNLTVSKTDLESFVLNGADRGQDDKYATLSNFSALLTTQDEEEPVDPEEPVVNVANEYSYTTDSELAHADAKGFTATVEGEDGSTQKVTWYASKDNGSNWVQLGESDGVTITGATNVVFGVILYDIPEDAAENVVAGYVIK